MSQKYEFKTRGKFYISLVLERLDSSSQTDELTNIAVHDAILDPLPPERVKRFWVLMTLFNYAPEEIDYMRIDLEDPPEYDNLISNFSKENKSSRVFVSSILKVPPVQMDLFYNAIATFCLPKSMLDSKIQFFLMFRDRNRQEIIGLGDTQRSGEERDRHLMPNVFCGYTQIVDGHLSDIFL